MLPSGRSGRRPQRRRPGEQNAKARRPATRSSAGSSHACSACNTSSHHAERLNADVPVTAVASANQVSRRFGDAGVVLEGILHLDSDKSVPGMLSRNGRTTLFTGDFWNVRHIRTTAGSNDRVSVVARVGPPSIALSVPVSLTPARKPHDGPGSVHASAQRTRRSNAARCLPSARWSCSSPGKQDTALSGLSRSTVGNQLVEVVAVGAALAPAAVANPRVLMMPGGHIVPNALRPLRRMLRPLAMARSVLL